MPGQDERAHATPKRLCEQYKQQRASKVLTATSFVLDIVLPHYLDCLSSLPPSLPSLPTHAGLPYMCLDLTSCSLAGSWLPETHGTSLTGAVYGVKGCIFVLCSFSFLSYHSVFLSFDLIHLVTTLMGSFFFIYVHFLVIVPCPKCLFLIVVILESSGERQREKS